MASDPSTQSDNVVVIGLGRFGSAVAESLVRLGHDVLGIDERAEHVQKWADRLTHVVEADATDSNVLRRLGVQDFGHAVVGIGTDIEASVLTVLGLAELGVPDIWAKATSANHGRILERTGAHHVVLPEAAMGERVAHMVTGKMIDFIEFDDGFAIVKTRAPLEAAGKTLEQSALRTQVRRDHRRDQATEDRLHLCAAGDGGRGGRPHHRVRPDDAGAEVRRAHLTRACFVGRLRPRPALLVVAQAGEACGRSLALIGG